MTEPFRPYPLLSNPHLQTLWTRIAGYKARCAVVWQSLSLPDSDFVDLAWSANPKAVLADAKRPLLIIFHGLEGSVRSPYADHLMRYCQNHGWHAVTFHFRSCSGRLNRGPRTYHSGDTADALFFLDWIQQRTNKPLFAAGFSLGGNMLVKLLGENPANGLTAAASVSAPLALGPSSRRLDQGFSTVYRNHLLASMKAKVRLKMANGHFGDTLALDLNELRRVRTLRVFDELVTAPLHGFANADDYYTRSSGLQFLPDITTPLRIFHAADDPFTCAACIPASGSYQPPVEHVLAPRGGHVGFIGAAAGKPEPWLSQAILHYFKQVTSR